METGEEILTNDYHILQNRDFPNENALKAYMVKNKEWFCAEVLGVKYKSHEDEFRFPAIQHLCENEPRADIVFTDTNDRLHIVELKCPRNAYNECMAGVGQRLSYYYLARVFGFNLGGIYLITSKHNNLVPLVIRDNNLKIKYIYFTKTVIAKVFK